MIVRLLLALSIITISIASSIYAKTKVCRKKKEDTTQIHFPINTQNIIDDLYQATNGFNISEKERQQIDDAGGNATYGEITYEGLGTLLKDLKLGSKDVFYDLGSGVGKVVVQVVLTKPAKGVGVELSPTRAQRAESVRQDMIQKGILKDKNRLKFIEGNITEVPLKDATVIFMCSTCFSNELMKQLTDNMAKLKKGLRVLTLKELPHNPAFKLVRTYEIPMTWSSNSPVYLYEKK